MQKLGKIDAEKLKVEILTYFDSQLASDERKTIQFALQHSLNIYLDQLLVRRYEVHVTLSKLSTEEFLVIFQKSNPRLELLKMKLSIIFYLNKYVMHLKLI